MSVIEPRDFGWALRQLKQGDRVARTGWNGKGMFVYHVPAASYPAQRNTKGTMIGIFPDDMVPYREYLAMKTAQNDVVPWVASQSDLLSEDWQLVVDAQPLDLVDFPIVDEPEPREIGGHDIDVDGPPEFR